MRLNLGSGEVRLDGYTNVDAHAPDADVRGDIRELSFSDVEEVRMDHVLEHLPWGDVMPTLLRIKGWMIPGAMLTVEVPDMAAIMEKPRPTWLTDIYGSQNNSGQFHACGFDSQSLLEALEQAGFTDIECTAFISDHPHRPGLPCIVATGRLSG